MNGNENIKNVDDNDYSVSDRLIITLSVDKLKSPSHKYSTNQSS